MAIYYVEAGHAGSDSGTEANPWLTIDQAMAGLGNGDKVWVKATATYTETATIDGFQAQWNTVVVFEGYTTTTGDGGKVTIDGGATRGQGLLTTFTGNTNYVFKNFIFTNHTGAGIGLGAIDRLVFKNCEFVSNGTTLGKGAAVGETCLFENCKFNSNTDDGVGCDIDCVFVGCEFKGNGASGINADGTVIVIDCLFISNASRALDVGGFIHDRLAVMVNCTVDGDSRDTSTGFYTTNSFRLATVLVNNIIYDCVTGVVFYNEEGSISRNNLLNNNGTDYAAGADTYTGEVTGAPVFIDEAAGDYTLAASSPAKNAGYDASTLIGDTPGRDIGAHESASAATAAAGGRTPRARNHNV